MGGYVRQRHIFNDTAGVGMGENMKETKDEIIYQSPPIGKKHDANKPRFSLLPSQIWQVIDVLEFGSKKYGVANWQNVDNAKERYFNACHRHLQAWWSGERLDKESGLPHLAHAVCCLLFLMWGDDELAKVHD